MRDGCGLSISNAGCRSVGHSAWLEGAGAWLVLQPAVRGRRPTDAVEIIARCYHHSPIRFNHLLSFHCLLRPPRVLDILMPSAHSRHNFQLSLLRLSIRILAYRPINYMHVYCIVVVISGGFRPGPGPPASPSFVATHDFFCKDNTNITFCVSKFYKSWQICSFHWTSENQKCFGFRINALPLDRAGCSVPDPQDRLELSCSPWSRAPSSETLRPRTASGCYYWEFDDDVSPRVPMRLRRKSLHNRTMQCHWNLCASQV